MGNYARYSLTVQCDEKKYVAKDIIAHLRQDYTEAAYALDEDGGTANEAKWYKQDKEMKEFSKKYPDVLFVFDILALAIDDEEYADENGNMALDIRYKNGVAS